MAALSTHKVQSDKDTVSKSLTLLQVCLLFEHFNLVFSVVINALHSICVYVCCLFIYLSFSHSMPGH